MPSRMESPERSKKTKQWMLIILGVCCNGLGIHNDIEIMEVLLCRSCITLRAKEDPAKSRLRLHFLPWNDAEHVLTDTPFEAPNSHSDSSP
jgi:hypothetical protein